MAAVHPSAVIESGAELAADVEVGPYCTIGANVVLAEGCRIGPHVNLTGHTTIGPRTRVGPFSSLGTPPQSTRYRGGPTRLVVGADCDIRESVTMNIGTEDGGGVTIVGNRCLFMVGSHVGHDCRVGDDVVLANCVAFGGHAVIGDNAVFGGNAAVHQFVRVGEGAMIAGVSGVIGDVIPFAFAIGQRAVLKGLNVVGLRRRGIGREELHRLRRAYRQLFYGGGTFQARVAEVEHCFGNDAFVRKMLAFIRSGKSRSLVQPERARIVEGSSGPPE